MSLYLLGISRSRDLRRVAEQPTVGQVTLRWVLADRLAGAVIDAPQVPPKPLQHAAVLEAIHRQICVLPMRFAAVPHDEAEIRFLLKTWHRDLLQRLDRLDGTCEMGLRIALPKCPTTQANPSPRTSPPASYLHERRAYYQRQNSLGDQARLTVEHLLRELKSTFRDWRRLTPSPPGFVRLAFLVERERVRLFRRCLRASVAEPPGHQWTLLGPWPPYSFV
jgi:hypothetical protein